MIKNLDDIREAGASSIKEVIGRYLPLKRAGVNWSACCPFHHEKTPSFNVSPERGTYKCFGCGEGGDAIQFIKEHENLTFPEAVEAVASIIGMDVEYVAGAQKTEVIERKREQKQLAEAQNIVLEKILEAWRHTKFPEEITDNGRLRWCSRVATKEEQLLCTIDGRDYSLSTLQLFELAYTSSRLTPLNDLADSLQLDKAIIGQLGLVKQGEYGPYDFFRDRIMFPIRDARGKLRGFAGRKLSTCGNPKIPKYMNSPESASFNKSEILYALHLAKRRLKEEREAIIVEGYTDAIAMHAAGWSNTVATCGTALTPDQCRLLKRYTNQALVLMDGDKAGKNAAIKAVGLLLEAGVMPKVCLLPDKEDPDSYLRKVGEEAFRKYITEKTQDGLSWRIMLEWDPDVEFSKIECYRLAAEMLVLIKDKLLRDEYVRTLCKKENMGPVTKRLNEAIKELEEKKLITRGRQLNRTQTHQSIHYGIFIDHDKYYEAGKNSTELTNFNIKPLMLIRGREQSVRLIEITNEFQKKFVTNVDSKVMTQFGLFKIFVEENGNFLFNEHAKESHWIRIRRMLYERMPTVYPIYTMGFHKAGFFTWSNGITDENGKFIPVNEYGVVEFNEVKYFIQSGAQLNTNLLSDDEEDEQEDQRNFAFVPGHDCPSFKEWSALFVETHGPRNGVIAVAWYVANFFRDITHPKYNSFPHLNAYGPPQAGKSFMGWNLQYLYGSTPKGFVNVQNDTVASLSRAVSWARDYIAWFDEYKNEMDMRRIEALKAFYDGKGRGKAKGAYGHGTVKSPVNSGVYLTGQEPPTRDTALMTRSICIKVPKEELTQERIDASEKLLKFGSSGVLTQLTASLMKYRGIVKAEWHKEYDAIRSQLRQYFADEKIKVPNRMIMNNALILSIFAKVAKFVEFSFSYTDLQSALVEVMIEQINDLTQEDEAGIFWQLVTYLLNDGRIRHQKDIQVEMSNKLTVYLTGGKSNKLTWKEPKKLIYVNFSRLHGLYMKEHKQQRGTEGNPLSMLKDYLAESDGYLGVAQKKLGGVNSRVLVFDTSELGTEFQLTAEVIRPSNDT